MSKVIIIKDEHIRLSVYSPAKDMFLHTEDSLREVPSHLIEEYDRVEQDWADVQELLKEYYDQQTSKDSG